jgi:hypothetical protein
MLNQFTVGGVPWNDGFVFKRHLAQVQPEVGFAVLLPRAMADEAVFGKDGADIAIEFDVSGLSDAEAR